MTPAYAIRRPDTIARSQNPSSEPANPRAIGGMASLSPMPLWKRTFCSHRMQMTPPITKISLAMKITLVNCPVAVAAANPLPENDRQGLLLSQIATDLRILTGDAKERVKRGHFEPDELAVRYHHRPVTIHPFPDGNDPHSPISADHLAQALAQRHFTWGGPDQKSHSDGRPAPLRSGPYVLVIFSAAASPTRTSNINQPLQTRIAPPPTWTAAHRPRPKALMVRPSRPPRG